MRGRRRAIGRSKARERLTACRSEREVKDEVTPEEWELAAGAWFQD